MCGCKANGTGVNFFPRHKGKKQQPMKAVKKTDHRIKSGDTKPAKQFYATVTKSDNNNEMNYEL